MGRFIQIMKFAWTSKTLRYVVVVVATRCLSDVQTRILYSSTKFRLEPSWILNIAFRYPLLKNGLESDAGESRHLHDDARSGSHEDEINEAIVRERGEETLRESRLAEHAHTCREPENERSYLKEQLTWLLAPWFIIFWFHLSYHFLYRFKLSKVKFT